MTTPSTSAQGPVAGWRYSINYGPDGEENYANVYAADGQLVGNLRTHHAIDICNAFAVCDKLASGPVCNLVPPPETYGGSPDEPWTGKMPAPPPAASPASPSGDAVAHIAEFLKERDESVLPDEADDAERAASAEEILRRASLASDATPAPTSGSEEGGEPRAWRDVLVERRRQVEAEGWTPPHDDEHGNGEMARAAASYALEHAAWTYTEAPSTRLMEAARSVWPWGKEWWKPRAGRRMLVKAAALILAEIERLDRKEGSR